MLHQLVARGSQQASFGTETVACSFLDKINAVECCNELMGKCSENPQWLNVERETTNSKLPGLKCSNIAFSLNFHSDLLWTKTEACSLKNVEIQQNLLLKKAFDVES